MSDRDWRAGLPVLTGRLCSLREPTLADASSLWKEICVPAVCRFVPPPPATVEGMEQTIRCAEEWRLAGRGFCFAVLPTDANDAAGVIQFLASRDASAAVSLDRPWEWGFALGERHWGTGMFIEAARMALVVAFQMVGLREIEAWVLQDNGRANGALAKLGACARRMPVTRAPDGRVADFVLWTIQRPSPSSPTGV